ncbi:hypothetical protein PR202_gb19226 [Eleusine coracana subsp. coracana]|uniref:Nucleolar protein 6 n=1 Tax=Eleusine coracana subsp. coracana TaxID=191504 RepID=A0AAV5F7Q9_ELECO|nr:hypothetical protein PR202_gb19226 [Eleusine coracana subsp. coracana]
MNFLANSKVWAKGLVIQPMKKRTVTKEDIANLLKTFDVAVCDVSGHVNLAFRMTNLCLTLISFNVQLQDEASCTLHYLDKCRDDEFEKLFMTKVDICAKFDSCLRINLKGSSKFTEISFCMDDESWRILEKDVQSLLQQGLTDRTKMIRVLWRSTPSEWNIMDGFSEFGGSPLLVGLIISSLEKSFRLVDIGPNPENRDEEILGEKAELRRFKDGTIAESTVWESKSWEKHTIIKRIADYVLMKHLSLENKDLIHVVDQLDFCLLVNGQDPVSSSGTLLEAFDTLAKQLRLLDDIPLKISTVQPLDSAFRHTCVFPPEPHPLAYGKSSQRLPNFATTCIPSLEVMIQLEGSGNWPLDPVAMEKTKSAFLLKIGESLTNYNRQNALTNYHKNDRFLRLLSSFDWTFSPMVIDINNDFNLKDEKEINENFMLSRKSYEQNPHDIERAMFLATSYDKASEAWTKISPSKSVLKRMASYAKSSTELLTNLILNGQSGQYTWECLFRTPMSNYDAVVLLHQEKLCDPQHVLFPAETPNGKLVTWGKPSKDFHPYMPLNKGAVKSLHDARDKLLCAFPKTFKMWYGSVGGDAVGLTWENPKKRSREDADETMPEPMSILKEVGDVGKGLVRGIYLLKAPKLQ